MRIFFVDFGGTTDVGEIIKGDLFIKSPFEFLQFILSGYWEKFDIGFFSQSSVLAIEEKLFSLRLPSERLWLVFKDHSCINMLAHQSSVFTSEMLAEFYGCVRKGDKPGMGQILSIFLLPTHSIIEK